MTFSKGEKPLTASQISHHFEIPIRLVQQILYDLVDSRIISDTSKDDSVDPAYQPAQDISRFSVRFVLDALDQKGNDNIPVAQTREYMALSDTLKSFGDVLEKLPENKLLKDI